MKILRFKIFVGSITKYLHIDDLEYNIVRESELEESFEINKTNDNDMNNRISKVEVATEANNKLLKEILATVQQSKKKWNIMRKRNLQLQFQL